MLGLGPGAAARACAVRYRLARRRSIPFSGAIDVNTVTSKTVFLGRLGDALENGGRDRDERLVGINRIVWDPFTNTLHVMADAPLDEHTRYALIVTRGRYRDRLGDAVEAAQRAGVREADIAVASVFTTQTFSHVVTRMRDAVRRDDRPPCTGRVLGNADSPAAA